MERFHKGFTLVELLIAVSILILLMMVVFLNVRGQTARAMDGKRKTDLYNLSKAFEDYDNDHSAFPDQSVVNDCGNPMETYLARIPCDPPASKTPYGYFPAVNGGYRICAKLADTTDPAIAAVGCAGPLGCGLGGPPSGGVYNYCLGAGVTASAVGTEDEIIGGAPTPVGGGGTPTPTPVGGGGTVTPAASPTPGGMGATTAPGLYACAPTDFLGNSYCKSYSDPIGFGCPKTYADTHCLNECQTYPAVRCIQ